MKKPRKLSIKHSLFTVQIICTVFVILIQLVFYGYINKDRDKKVKEYIDTNISQLENNIFATMNGIKDSGFSLSYNSAVISYLTEKDIMLKKAASDNVLEMIRYMMSANKSIMGITLWDGNDFSNFNSGSYSSYLSPAKREYLLSRDTAFFVDAVWEESERFKDYYYYVINVFDPDDYYNIRKKIGSIIILCDMRIIHKAVNTAILTENTEMMIADKDGTIITSNNEQLIGETYILSETGGQRRENGYIVIEKEISNTDWFVISRVAVNDIALEQQSIQNVFLLSGVIMLMLFFVINYFVNRYVKHPISVLVNDISHMGEESIKQRIKPGMNDELRVISTHINLMLDKIEGMTKNIFDNQQRLYEMELSKKIAEFSALQSQINPHFLYNTLECIRSIGTVHDIKPIADISTAMAEIFRYSIKEKDYVSIRQEMDIVKEYLRIVQIRFSGRYQIFYNIDEEILPYYTIKMILQPIVENAVYHGLESKETGSLSITGKKEGESIIFEIKDDGVGFDKRQLEKFLKQQDGNGNGNGDPTNGKSIGLINIHRRIKLFLGNGYGISVDSAPDKGTTVTLKLPILKNPK